ncbi:hypothetical protein P171DRAFT_428788 [Karstenula rhodostoma CBS 690.94]|uniref:Uncharacterized protein n=1 Tax=Karstenula rhodostoma CBS 690.94 TaxID=1392251 RepID=A0A9P4PR81_9PLEO|nr:hypothetical protein P171DRAFT_428788 [Karstenula rhodostoma CBS 690.94]
MFPLLSTLKHQLNGRKWGYVIFRCTYGDDASWDRFMAYLQAKVRDALETEGADDMYEQLDWKVQEDMSLWDASPETVKTRFQEWLKEHEDDDSVVGTRSHACIMIDRAVLDALEDLHDDIDVEDYDESGAIWVHMISSYEVEKPTRVGVDYLIPTAYTEIELDGWYNVELQEGEDVARPGAWGRYVED